MANTTIKVFIASPESDRMASIMPRRRRRGAWSVAFVVLDALRLACDGYSFPYMARWALGDVEAVRDTASRVIDCSTEILKGLEVHAHLDSGRPCQLSPQLDVPQVLLENDSISPSALANAPGPLAVASDRVYSWLTMRHSVLETGTPEAVGEAGTNELGSVLSGSGDGSSIGRAATLVEPVGE